MMLTLWGALSDIVVDGGGDRLLVTLEKNAFKVQGYTDDVFILPW